MEVRRRPRFIAIICVFVVILIPCENIQIFDLSGHFCQGRQPIGCCPGRDDSCTVPILGTLCYCDIFCNRTSGSDCCPDFWAYCIGIPPPDNGKCHKNGKVYKLGDEFKDNCNICTCRETIPGVFALVCDDKPCIIRPNLIHQINQGNHGWKASNYSFFWGKTLEYGVKYYLGTSFPSKSTMSMTEIHSNAHGSLPSNFDARVKWPTWINPIRNQGSCGASWAFSSTAVASDRLAITSGGSYQVTLSPQHLLSCQTRKQNGCTGGHLDRAWWFFRKRGVSSESCYPYYSGQTSVTGLCEIKRFKLRSSKIPNVRCLDGRVDILYLSTPPYRIAEAEKAIMQEIYQNGPVQATFLVKEDFYSYRAGIYSHTEHSKHLPKSYQLTGWHSVRIIGWGEDRSKIIPVKYWLCANSWGTEWGEDGYFRILRGTNECNIESFVVGVWANLEEFNDKSIINPHALSKNIRIP